MSPPIPLLSDAAPQLSIVVPTCDAVREVVQCLSALHRSHLGDRVETIVADGSVEGVASMVEGQFLDVRVLPRPVGSTLPQLREAGIAAARGQIVALLDPYCIPDPGWAEEVMTVHRERHDGVIGGSVELDREEGPALTRWATYLADYAAFVPPLAEGPVADLPGGNISYKAWALKEGGAPEGGGFWKTMVNRRLLARGYGLWQTPRMSVRLRKPISCTVFFLSRYDHGRCFAAMRSTGMGRVERILRALASPVLPGIALWRRWRSLGPKRQVRRVLLKVTPLLLLFDAAWAWGEFWGYVRGSGRSCERLFF